MRERWVHRWIMWVLVLVPGEETTFRDIAIKQQGVLTKYNDNLKLLLLCELIFKSIKT